LTIARSRPISRRAWEASSGAFRTNCYSNLGLVADSNGGLPQRLPVTVARLLFRVPERRPEIEVEDRNARGAPLQRCQRRGAARFVGEPRARDPEQGYRRDRVKVEVFDRQVHIGGLRLAVEQDREVVWRVDLTERQGVLRSGSVPTQRLSTPNSPSAERMYRPKSSSPTLVMTAEGWPSLAAATATWVALPPSDLAKVSTSASLTPIYSGYRSTLTLPIVMTSGLTTRAHPSGRQGSRRPRLLALHPAPRLT
jgi:hypothetical protein